MPEAAIILERIDRCLRELQAIKTELVASMPALAAEGEILAAADDDDADFRPHLMLWPSEAAARFGFAVDTVRYLCRTANLGRKYGHRWRASIPRFQRYVNGGG